MRALVLVMMLVTTAHADRQAAELLEREAKADRDPAKYDACGKAYLDVYNADPRAPDADAMLYNAGVCLDNGHSAGGAIQVFTLLRKMSPASRLAPRALARLGILHGRVGNLAEAAALLTEYSMKYAGEKDANMALSDAIYLYRVLGDDAKSIAETERYVRFFGVKRPSDAASALLALGPVYERKGPAEAIKNLRTVLMRYGGKLDATTKVQIHVRLGELLWQDACPVPTTDGLCVKRVRERPLPLPTPKLQATSTRCGPPSTTQWTVIERDNAKGAEAEKAFSEARKLFEQRQSIQDPAARHFYARALLAQGDRELEAYLAVKFPVGLDFDADKRDASMKRLERFVTEKQKLGAVAQQRFETVLATKDATGAVAAVSRLGMLQAMFAEQLLAAEIPKPVRTGTYASDKIAAYCSALNAIAEPLLKAAESSYDACLAKAGELGIVNAPTKLCERELAHLAPTASVVSELVPAPRPAFAIASEPPTRPRTSHSTGFKALLEQHAKSQAPCPLAGKFEQVAKTEKLADAFYMAGLVYAGCGKRSDAQVAYDRALAIEAHPAARSNLGTLAWQAGKPADARRHWEAALGIRGKLFAAHLNLAAVGLLELAAAADQKRALEDIKLHAYSAAVVDGDSPLPHAVLAIALVDAQPALARYHATEAAKLDDRSPSVSYALAVVALRDDSALAFARLQVATQTDALEDAHLALGMQHARLRRWGDATKALARVTSASYELAIAKGIVARGQGKHADAVAAYDRALALDAKRPEAHFNLGIAHRATALIASDPKPHLKKAAEAFRRAGTAEAKLLAEDSEKALAAL